jgi:hypothetical protein
MKTNSLLHGRYDIGGIDRWFCRGVEVFLGEIRVDLGDVMVWYGDTRVGFS